MARGQSGRREHKGQKLPESLFRPGILRQIPRRIRRPGLYGRRGIRRINPLPVVPRPDPQDIARATQDHARSCAQHGLRHLQADIPKTDIAMPIKRQRGSAEITPHAKPHPGR